MWEVDAQSIRDLLGTPGVGPAAGSTAAVPTTDPAHLGSEHELAISSDDRAGETILPRIREAARSQRAWRPSGDWLGAPHATGPSRPGTPGDTCEWRRCDAAPARSSMVLDRYGERSHVARASVHAGSQSLLVQ